VPGPDFPTGAADAGSRSGGKGLLEGAASVNHPCQNAGRGRSARPHAIIVEQIPYQVNKARFEKIAEQLCATRDRKALSHVQDESGP